jgi:uncharacterized tellurite resistance protein B-like protein
MANLDEIRLAYAWNTAVEMMMSDGQVAPEEAAMVGERYASKARDLGLVDVDGRYTARYREALAEAPAKLITLPREDRVAILGEIIDVVLADGVIDMAEADKVEKVVALLALDHADVEALLRR